MPDHTYDDPMSEPATEQPATDELGNTSLEPTDETLTQDYVNYQLPDLAATLPPTLQPPTTKPPSEPLTISIELGRQKLTTDEINQLTSGSRVKLQQAANHPVDLYIKQQCIGTGELLIREGKLCIRISYLNSPARKQSA